MQQEMILVETARVYSHGLNRPDLDRAQVRAFTMEAFMLSVFQHFIDRYRQLFTAGGHNPNTPAGQAIVCAVLGRVRLLPSTHSVAKKQRFEYL